MGRKKPAKEAQKQKGKEQQKKPESMYETTNFLTDFHNLNLYTDPINELPVTGVDERKKYQEGMKKMFRVYYAQREQEEKECDLDFLTKTIERDCYNGYTRDCIADLEECVILLINKDRVAHSKKPFSFNIGKGDFDITVEEIELQLRPLCKSEDVKHWARCLYDVMDDKYNLKPMAEDDKLDLQEHKNAKNVTIQNGEMEDITIRNLEITADAYDREAKLLKANGKNEKKMNVFIKARETHLKCVQALRQYEKLKDIKKNCKESQNHVELVGKGLQVAMKTLICLLDMESMDDTVDDFYLFLIKKRHDNEETPLTLHRIDGTFDLKMEEVQGAARYMKNMSKMFPAFTSDQLAYVIFDQFEKRHKYVKKFGKRREQAMSKLESTSSASTSE